MIGFFFANRHSSEFNTMAMVTSSRTLLPPMRRNDYQVAGRDGTVDFGGETYDTRQPTIDICFIDRDAHNLQALSHEVAHWLSGKGLLIFDDNPTKALDAVIYEGVEAEELYIAKRASVTFECQPDYKTISPLQSLNPDTASGNVIDIFSHGTRPTPGLFILRNTGNVALNNIVITRRSLTS